MVAAFQGDVEQPGLRIAVSEQAAHHLLVTGHRLRTHAVGRQWMERDLQAGAALVRIVARATPTRPRHGSLDNAFPLVLCDQYVCRLPRYAHAAALPLATVPVVGFWRYAVTPCARRRLVQ